MGNPQTLVDFVSWSKTNYPADHYALYMWGHGWSWHPGVVMQDDTNANALDYHEMKPIMNTLGFMDVVGYDGCNMGSIEIQSLWHVTRPHSPLPRNGSVGMESNTTWSSRNSR